MDKTKTGFSVIDLALLKAYLLQVFANEQVCKQDMKHTLWYLSDRFNDATKEKILEYLKEQGISCDCGVIEKLHPEDDEEFKNLISSH